MRKKFFQGIGRKKQKLFYMYFFVIQIVGFFLSFGEKNSGWTSNLFAGTVEGSCVLFSFFGAFVKIFEEKSCSLGFSKKNYEGEKMPSVCQCKTMPTQLF